MDHKKLQQKIEEYLNIIEKNGVSALFDSYDANDVEGNYLKNKILSQVHYDEVTELTDEEHSRYLECDTSRKSFFVTKAQYEELEKIDKIEPVMLFESFACKYVIDNHGTEMETFIDEYKQKLNEYKSLSFYEKIKRRKEIENNKDLLKGYLQEYNYIKEEMLLKDEKHDVVLEKNPVIKNCIDNIEQNNINTMDKAFTLTQIATWRSCVSKFIIQCLQDVESVKNWYIRSNNVATAVLTTMKLPPNLTFDEFSTETRSKFSSIEDRVDFSFRNYNIPTSLGGGIGAFAARVENLDAFMQKMKNIFDKIKFDQLSKKDIIDFAAKFSCKFIEIHPYSNGNGRTSRMIIDYILMSNGIESPVLYTGKESKCKYLEALESSRKKRNSDFTNYIIEKHAEQFGTDLNDDVWVDI